MEQVPNRFHLVQMASIRAKQLKKGARPLLSSEENKQVVMALREIAAGLVKPGEIETSSDSSQLAAEPTVTELAGNESAGAETASESDSE